MALNKSDSSSAPQGGSNKNVVSSKLITELGEDTQHSAVVDRIREHVSAGSGETYSIVEFTFEKSKSNATSLKGKSASAYLDRFHGNVEVGSRIAVNLKVDVDGYPSIAAGGKRLNFVLSDG